MTDQLLDALKYTLWAELQLPALPEFTANHRGELTSQDFEQTSGFMAKFVSSYNVTLRFHPEPAADSLFAAGCDVTVRYQHGKWERGGSNGVSTTLFFPRGGSRWVDQNTARALAEARRAG